MEIQVSRLAELVGGRVKGDFEKRITGAAPFDQAGDTAVTFADKPALWKQLDRCSAGAVVVPVNISAETATTLILVDNPRLAFAIIMEAFHPRRRSISGISPAASVGRHFTCGSGVVVGPGAFIGERVTLGDRAVIHPNVYIGDSVSVGDDTEIHPNVSILDGCIIGSRVIIHAGTVIGSDGFGFTPDGGRHHKIPQVGIVQIDDDVEVGAGNTIDRATFGRTWIKQGVKTDNHVHIAHNVTVGEHSIIVAQVGIAGSATIGKHVILAGQAGIAGHLTVGDGAIVGPQAGVSRTVPPGHVVSGTPEMPHRIWLRVQQVIPKLPEMKKKIAEIEKRLDAAEKNSGKGDGQEES